MAQSGLPNSIGSQFYIVQNPNLDANFRQEFNLILDRFMDEIIWQDPDTPNGPSLTYGDTFRREMMEHYLAVGGTPFLDFPFNTQGPNYGHTVFGHVVEGMDVVDAIAATPRDANDRPLEDVIIQRVSVVIYQG
jgi:cyclophilin family peptidyl-prolyl cis-trans isomerase